MLNPIQTVTPLLEPSIFAMLLIGSILGIVVGAIPGLTGAMLIALSLPLTFTMPPEQALTLLVAMYVGSVSGGLVTATLMRIPGTPASMMTILDGYPMAKSGRPGRALGLGVSASFAGGMISWIFLITLSGPMALWSTQFGPWEYFSLVLMSLVLIASVSGESLLRGLLAGAIGISLAMPGSSPATGTPRLTFGFAQLDDGLKLLPVLIGLFAINQILQEVLRASSPIESIRSAEKASLLSWRDWIRHATNMLRSSIIGTWVGILPGVGANIGSVIAYSTAKNWSKDAEAFGNGSEEGIVAAESGNNATVGGALIPLVAMGIPGSVIDAILLGALVIHGIQPGPLLMQQNPDAVYTIAGAMLGANIVVFIIMLLVASKLVHLTRVPLWVLVPVVLTFCVVGSYALANRMFDVWVMLAMGLVGLGLERAKIPLAPLVIGFVLAPLAEENLCAGLMQSGGSYVPLVVRPISLLFSVAAMGMLVWSVYKRPRQAADNSG